MSEKIFMYRRKCILNYEKLFWKFIDRLVAEFEGEVSIVLFGSRGRGNNRESSDYDLLVVLRERVNENYLRVLRLKPSTVPMDIIIVGLSELSNPVLRKMLEQSKVLYDGLNCFQ